MARRVDLGKIIPEKGVDYYTEAEKDQMENEITDRLVGLYKRYESTYTTISADEDTIPIEIRAYDENCILEVYIEGRILNQDEYEISQDNESIVLTNALSEVGTVVQFVVYKFAQVDSEDYNILKGEPGELQLSDIEDNLNSNSSNKLLSAKQGKILNDTKANIETVANLQTQINSVASGSPAGVYATVSDLTTADPDHSKIYVVSADGHWYYYGNSQWNDGGVYQAYEDSTTLDNIAQNYIKSENLYNPSEVETQAITDGAGTWQKYTINNPTYNHLYSCFNKQLRINFNNARFIQYNGDTVLKQYTAQNYATNPIETNCNKLVLININNTTTPLDMMILDMTGKELSEITNFIDYYDTIKRTTHLLDIEPNELKGSIPYNLYNKENVYSLDGTFQTSILYNVANKNFGFYCFVNNQLKRLTSNNFNNKYLVAIAYSANRTELQRFNNPSGDITIPANAITLEVNIINNTEIAYDNVMFINKTIYSDDEIEKIGYLPYSYFLNSPYYIKKAVIDENSGINNKPYANKKILSLGDSFTYMNYYGQKLSEITGCEQTPRGYNGGNIGVFVSDRYTPTGGGGEVVESTFNAELLAPYDIVTVMGGTNNYGRSMALGTIDDEPALNTSVCAEVKRVIDKILTLKPSIKIIWCTEPYRIIATETAPSGYLPNQAGYTMEEMNEKIIEICKHYGIPVFDFYHNSNWNNYTVKYDSNNQIIENIYTYDGLHPKFGNGNGGELLGISFGNFINSM